MAKSEAMWNTIDTDTLPAAIAKLHRSYKDSYAETKNMRLAFEEAMSAAIDPPKGKRVAFSYNFGKLSVAIVDDEQRAAPKGTVSLASLRRS